MTNFDVQIIFKENGKTFDSLICDIVNTFLIRSYINTCNENINDIFHDNTIYHSNLKNHS